MMLLTALPLLAVIQIKLLIFIVVMVLYVLNHLISAVKKPPVKNDPRSPAAPRPPGQTRQQVDNELNDFLRRAAEKRAEASQMPAAIAPSREPPRSRKKKSPAPAPALVEQPLSQRRMVNALEARDEARGLEAPIGQLAQSVNEIDSHVQQVFDHRLGQLGAAMPSVSGASASGTAPSPVEADDKVALAPSIASEISALLANPRSLQGAIILNEILSRPEQRW